MRIVVSEAGRRVFWLIFLMPSIFLGGCRGGEGSECLSDTECLEGLICSKNTTLVDNGLYDSKAGTCIQDDDRDNIPSDGDFDGSFMNHRCGVHVALDPQTSKEKVYEKILDGCDDNCTTMRNEEILKRFVCEPECSVGADATPGQCFLSFSKGYEVDERGCVQCQQRKKDVACSGAADSCAALVRGNCGAADPSCLPAPHCSGQWQCTGRGGTCKFYPEMAESPDQNGVRVLFQYDQDWDGLGDKCDNCPIVPNGIECANPVFKLRCDANRDGVVTPEEYAIGEQADRDGDGWGDACDLCPDLAGGDNNDLDGDGLGNACDPDQDGDGSCDPLRKSTFQKPCTGTDNCPTIANRDQADMNKDGEGDVCDPDLDGDGIRQDGDSSGVAGDNPCQGGDKKACDDNCPTKPNSGQEDGDSDGVGDACES